MAGGPHEAPRTAVPSRCGNCAIRGYSPCGGLRDLHSLDRLDRSQAASRFVASGSAVFGQGDAATSSFTVLTGWIALSDTLADGRTVILHFALPGDVVPLEFIGDRSSRTAFAIDDATVCAISRARHDILRHEDALYADRYLAAVARELHLAYDHFVNIALSSAGERVIKLLWELAIRNLRRRPATGETILLPLTQTQISLSTGMTPVHVSRTLARLRKDRLVDFKNHRMTVLNVAAVERLAGISEDTMALWLGAMMRGPDQWIGDH